MRSGIVRHLGHTGESEYPPFRTSAPSLSHGVSRNRRHTARLPFGPQPSRFHDVADLCLPLAERYEGYQNWRLKVQETRSDPSLMERALKWSYRSFLLEISGIPFQTTYLVTVSDEYIKSNQAILDEYEARAPEIESPNIPLFLAISITDPMPRNVTYKPDERTYDEKEAAKTARVSIERINSFVDSRLANMTPVENPNDLMKTLAAQCPKCYLQVVRNLKEGHISLIQEGGVQYLNFRVSGPAVREFFRECGFTSWGEVADGVRLSGEKKGSGSFNNSNPVRTQDEAPLKLLLGQ